MQLQTSYYACPKCKSYIFVSNHPISELRYWSDGSLQAPFVPEHEDNVLECPVCRTVFWREDATYHETIPENERHKIVGNYHAPFDNLNVSDDIIIADLIRNIEFYKEKILQRQGNTFERELYLRVKYVRAINDLRRPYRGFTWRNIRLKHFTKSILSVFGLSYREYKAKYKTYLSSKRINLQRIIIMIEGKNSLFEIEAYRELRYFNHALKLLNSNKIPERNKLFEENLGTASIIYPDININYRRQLKINCIFRNSDIFEFR
jgi:hypothetical protein